MGWFLPCLFWGRECQYWRLAGLVFLSIPANCDTFIVSQILSYSSKHISRFPCCSESYIFQPYIIHIVQHVYFCINVILFKGLLIKSLKNDALKIELLLLLSVRKTHLCVNGRDWAKWKMILCEKKGNPNFYRLSIWSLRARNKMPIIFLFLFSSTSIFNLNSKLYIPNTINIWKKVLTKAIWADKKSKCVIKPRRAVCKSLLPKGLKLDGDIWCIPYCALAAARRYLSVGFFNKKVNWD